MENSEQPKVVKTRALPAKDLEIGATATIASAKWTSSAWLTLLWLTAAQFATSVTNYKILLNARNISGGSKKGVVKQMELLNREINDSMAYVKNYILEIFKKDRATSMYATFGILDRNGHHEFPEDIDGRSIALTTLISAIDDNGLNDREYGRDYWADIQLRYDNLAAQTTFLSTTISGKVGDKNQTKKDVKKGLNALIKCIQANYPDTWKEELREWGFLKERY